MNLMRGLFQKNFALKFLAHLPCSQGERDVEIRFDVVFHLLKCTDLEIKVEDSKGVTYDPSHVAAYKVPMTNGVETISNAAEANGCRMFGVLGVKKVRTWLFTTRLRTVSTRYLCR